MKSQSNDWKIGEKIETRFKHYFIQKETRIRLRFRNTLNIKKKIA